MGIMSPPLPAAVPLHLAFDHRVHWGRVVRLPVWRSTAILTICGIGSRCAGHTGVAQAPVDCPKCLEKARQDPALLQAGAGR